MPTRYRLVPENQHVDVDLAILRSALPPSIVLKEESGDVYAIVDSTGSEDSSTQLLIDRELDRLFFMTCVRLRAAMCRRIVTSTLKGSWRVHGPLPAGVLPQIWTDQITLQLRLWALASDVEEVSLKVLLLYQIIELSPQKKAANLAYDDPSWPAPRTEAKLLRNVVAHAGEPTQRGTEAYLEFLGLTPMLSNLVDPQWVEKITERVAVVQQVAREVLQSALSQVDPP